MRTLIQFSAAALVLVAAILPAGAQDATEIYFQGLRGLVDQAAINADTLHAEVKSRAGSTCRIRIALHHGTLEDSQRLDGYVDLDLAKLQIDDIVTGMRAVEADRPGVIAPVVYLIPSAPAAVALFDGRKRGHVGDPAFPQLFVTARYDFRAAARDPSLRDDLAREATELLALTLQRFVEACRDKEQTTGTGMASGPSKRKR